MIKKAGAELLALELMINIRLFNVQGSWTIDKSQSIEYTKFISRVRCSRRIRQETLSIFLHFKSPDYWFF